MEARSPRYPAGQPAAPGPGRSAGQVAEHASPATGERGGAGAGPPRRRSGSPGGRGPAAAGPAAVPGRSRAAAGRRRLHGSGLRAAIAWIGPSYLIFILVMAFPLVWNIVESFFSTSYGQSHFVGLANYRQIVGSGQFYSAFWLTLYWTAGVFAGQFLLGFTLALFFNRRIRLARYLRPFLLLPWAIPGIVSSTAWVFLYAQHGLINQILSPFLKAGPAWLADPHLAMPAVIIAGIWKGAPFYFLMLLAGLQSIPPQLAEAARLDGAGRAVILLRIELPYIRNILAVTSALGLIWTANYFDGIYLMTGGGPVNATTTLPIWIYNTAFSDFNLSEASALSVLLLIIVLVIAVPYLVRGRGDDVAG